MQIASDAIRRHLIGGEAAGCDFYGQAPRGLRDFLPCAVIECNDERETAVAAGQILRLLQEEADIAIQSGALADDAHPHVVPVQFSQIIADKPSKQPHQIHDFRRGPRPILRAEGKDRQNGNAEFARCPHGAAQCLYAAAVALDPGQPARGRPAPVTVHNDGDMSWHIEAVVSTRERLACAVSRSCGVTQTVMISFSFPARSLSTSAMVASVTFCTSPD